MGYYLGLDVGSVSTNLVLVDERGEVAKELYLRTEGRPLVAIQKGLLELAADNPKILGAGTTGSGRRLAGVLIGADVVKNEITAHAVAASSQVPSVRTVLEIGGQDSKLIILREGVVVDFAMNTVCAAGTGSFLDHQATRLGVPIEEFGALALKAQEGVRIAGRCAVFAESDMIHKQQLGYPTEEIVAGLCSALVRNYLNNVAKGKELLPKVVFQGGVAANAGMRKAFEAALEQEIFVPEHYSVMGAVGAALLAQEEVESRGGTKFKGLAVAGYEAKAQSFECPHCPNQCEVVEIKQEGEVVARWGDRCGRWSSVEVAEKEIGEWTKNLA